MPSKSPSSPSHLTFPTHLHTSCQVSSSPPLPLFKPTRSTCSLPETFIIPHQPKTSSLHSCLFLGLLPASFVLSIWCFVPSCLLTYKPLSFSLLMVPHCTCLPACISCEIIRAFSFIHVSSFTFIFNHFADTFIQGGLQVTIKQKVSNPGFSVLAENQTTNFAVHEQLLY